MFENSNICHQCVFILIFQLAGRKLIYKIYVTLIALKCCVEESREVQNRNNFVLRDLSL